MRSKLLAGALLTGAAILAGCGGGGYYASYGPPAPRSYVAVGVAPGPGYVWTNGYWDWRGRNWSWVEGRWMRPPRSRAVWVAPEWRHEGRGYRFHRGHWR
jgi:WXXGXW repeat (2 copies)